MVSRKASLHSVLQPISLSTESKRRAVEAVAALLAGYPNLRAQDPAQLVATYVATLQDQPLFAVRQACADFAHRRVYDEDAKGQRVFFSVDHAPSAFRLLDQVKKVAQEFQAEKAMLERVLAITEVKERAPDLSADEQRYVQEGLRKLADGMLSRATRDREAERLRIQQEARDAEERARRILAEARRRRDEEVRP